MPLPAIAARNPSIVTRARPAQRRVEQGSVLALQETDAAETVRQRDRGAGAFLGEDRGGAFLVRGVERRKDRGDRDRLDAVLADLPRRLAHAGFVERHELAAVVIMPAFQHHDPAAHDFGEIDRPIAKRRQRGACRQPDPNPGDAGQSRAAGSRR